MTSNEKYQRTIQRNSKQAISKVDKTHTLGKEITEIEHNYLGYVGKENRYAQKDHKYSKDMADMIEYVTWITNETGILRNRVRAAESVISQLRKSGETSVESLIDTLFKLRKEQEKLDAEAESLRT
jgi:hypothetical protein